MSPLFQNYELFWHINSQQLDTFAVINMANSEPRELLVSTRALDEMLC